MTNPTVALTWPEALAAVAKRLGVDALGDAGNSPGGVEVHQAMMKHVAQLPIQDCSFVTRNAAAAFVALAAADGSPALAAGTIRLLKAPDV